MTYPSITELLLRIETLEEELEKLRNRSDDHQHRIDALEGESPNPELNRPPPPYAPEF